MKRKEFCTTCALGAAAMLISEKSDSENTNNLSTGMQSPFKLRGIYFHDGFTVDPKYHAPLYWDRDAWFREIRWLQACGINAVEFATMLEFNRIPQTALERQKIMDRLQVLELAHGLGLKFGYILTNTVVSTVPDGEEPSHQSQNRAVQLCPQDPNNFSRTVSLQEWYMNTYHGADFFEEFAADWGACHCGKCDVSDYMRYVQTFAEKLQTINPTARLYANTWSIAYWGPSPEEQGWLKVFENEIRGSREVITKLATMPANTHLCLPCHHLYRPLTYQQYGGRDKTPIFPTSADIHQVKSQGREVMAWPHFIMDDDISRAPQWGIVHSEVRYIRALLQSLLASGIDRVIGNLYLPFLQLSNTYAYGRLLQDPHLAVQQVISDFANLIAVPEDTEQLTEVLTWIENHSYWQEQMPEDGRLPELPCTLNKTDALNATKRIRPNETPDLPLPYPSAKWLEDLERSIERMDWTT
jgi:hypothetical protein